MAVHLSQQQYVAVLAAVAAAILGIGALLRPKKVPEAVISQAEMLRLQKLSQRRNLENLTSFFSEVAANVDPHFVWLNELERGGLVWNENGLVVTAGPAEFLPQTIGIAVQGTGPMRAEASAFAEDLPVAAFQTPKNTQLRPVQRGSPERLTPGTWIVQVARQENGGRVFTAGVYGGTVAGSCGDHQYREVQSSLSLSAAMLGGGLFDLDGKLLAMVVRCGQRFTAAAPASIEAALKQAGTLAGGLLQRYGMRVAPLDDHSRAYFKAKSGILVTEVWHARVAEDAGIRPGDVIVALGGEPVNVPDDLKRLAAPLSQPNADLKVLRAGKPVSVKLGAGETARADTNNGNRLGIHLQEPPRGYLVEQVASGGAAGEAKIRPGDRLLEVGGRQLTSMSSARRVFARHNGDPTWVVLQRGPRTLGVFLR